MLPATTAQEKKIHGCRMIQADAPAALATLNPTCLRLTILTGIKLAMSANSTMRVVVPLWGITLRLIVVALPLNRAG
jgi:hypothetical protein